MQKSLIAGLCLFAWLLVAAPLPAENWPQWRGPRDDGISTETGIPATWGATKNIAWTAPLPGMGGSTPAVWGDRLFLTCEDGGDVVLLGLGTDGKALWKRKFGRGGSRYRRDEANNASASPSTDGKHVYAFAGSGELACFDFAGKEVWKTNLQDRYGKFSIQHGLHVTPLLDGDRIYMPLLHANAAVVVALNKADGSEAWKVTRKTDAREESKEAYSSPVIWRKGKDAYLVILGGDYATGHRLDDGQEIWRLAGLNPKATYNDAFRLVATPVATPDLIVVPTCKNGPVVGLKPGARGLIGPGDRMEQWRRARNTPDVPSPLVHDGLVYLCRENGALLCLDAKTGKEYYSRRLHASRYRASPLYVDGKIILTARDGTFTVIKPGRTFELLATNKLPDEFTASPAVSGGRLYLRGFKTLYAIGPVAK